LALAGTVKRDGILLLASLVLFLFIALIYFIPNLIAMALGRNKEETADVGEEAFTPYS